MTKLSWCINSPLGPLIVNALVSGSARTLSEWVENLPSPHLYFNFIASHDGIGLLPAQGILDPAEIELLIRLVRKRTEACFPYKTDTNGERQVYELNITLYDMLNDPFRAAAGIRHCPLSGFTGHYAGAGRRAWRVCAQPGLGPRIAWSASRIPVGPRSINREKFDVSELKQALSADDARAAQVLKRYLNLVEKRVSHSAFGPQAAQKILRIDDRVFALLRADKSSGERILCLSNLTANDLEIEMDISKFRPPSGKRHIERLDRGWNLSLYGWKFIHQTECLPISLAACVAGCKPGFIFWTITKVFGIRIVA